MDLREAAGSPEGDTCGLAVCHSQGTAILSAGGVRGPEGPLTKWCRADPVHSGTAPPSAPPHPQAVLPGS